MHLGLAEIIAILLVVLLLFGPGRIEKLAGEMGKGIRSFREGIQSKKEKDEDDEAGEAETTEKEKPASGKKTAKPAKK